MGFELRIGLEIEFTVFKDKENMEPIEFNNDSNLHSLVSYMDDFDQIYKKLLANKIQIEAIHKECGFGQFEMVITYGEVFKVLDDYFIAKEVIAQHFRQKGLLATFLPKPQADGMGNGAHIHMSLWRNGANCTGSKSTPHQMSLEGEAFLAGILRHFDAAFHFLCPSPNSLKRISGSSFVGTYKVWGIENKEAPLRVVIPLKPCEEGVQHFEIKSFDHTANHYFGVAVLVSLGTLGLRESLRLPQPYNEDADLLTEEQRSDLCIKRLPLTFEERCAVINSKAGQPIRDYFGEELINNILLVH